MKSRYKCKKCGVFISEKSKKIYMGCCLKCVVGLWYEATNAYYKSIEENKRLNKG